MCYVNFFVCICRYTKNPACSVVLCIAAACWFVLWPNMPCIRPLLHNVLNKILSCWNNIDNLHSPQIVIATTKRRNRCNIQLKKKTGLNCFSMKEAYFVHAVGDKIKTEIQANRACWKYSQGDRLGDRSSVSFLMPKMSSFDYFSYFI